MSRLVATSTILISLRACLRAGAAAGRAHHRPPVDRPHRQPAAMDRASCRRWCRSLDFSFLERFWGQEKSVLAKQCGRDGEAGRRLVRHVISGLWQSGQAFFSIASLLVITPVVAFYLLYDWDNMVSRLDDLLPRDHRDTIHRLMSEIDAAVAGFVRGQGTLCLVLGLFYATALTVAGLNFGLVIGLVAGHDFLHTLCWLDHRPAAFGRRRARAVLARLDLDRDCRGHLLLRPVRGRQRPADHTWSAARFACTRSGSCFH